MYRYNFLTVTGTIILWTSCVSSSSSAGSSSSSPSPSSCSPGPSFSSTPCSYYKYSEGYRYRYICSLMYHCTVHKKKLCGQQCCVFDGSGTRGYGSGSDFQFTHIKNHQKISIFNNFKTLKLH
jgi:hypothetical protein